MTPELARFHFELAVNLRCPKCQNQDGWLNAPVASDMRQKIYEQHKAGKTDDEVVQYMVDRYGDCEIHPSLLNLKHCSCVWPCTDFIFGLLLFVLAQNQGQISRPLSADRQARLNIERKAKLWLGASPLSFALDVFIGAFGTKARCAN